MNTIRNNKITIKNIKTICVIFVLAIFSQTIHMPKAYAQVKSNENIRALSPENSTNNANNENNANANNAKNLNAAPNKATTSNDLLEQQIYQRFNDKDWHKKLAVLNERALWQEYIYLQNMQNYLSNLQGNKKEHIEAMLANYTSLKLRQNMLQNQQNKAVKK